MKLRLTEKEQMEIIDKKNSKISQLEQEKKEATEAMMKK